MNSLPVIHAENDHAVAKFMRRGGAMQKNVDAAVAAVAAKAERATRHLVTKPTTDSIRAAYQAAHSLACNAQSAAEHLHAADHLFRADATARSVASLKQAREALVVLRRTQTAALENIDAALDSAKGAL